VLTTVEMSLTGAAREQPPRTLLLLLLLLPKTPWMGCLSSQPSLSKAKIGVLLQRHVRVPRRYAPFVATSLFQSVLLCLLMMCSQVLWFDCPFGSTRDVLGIYKIICGLQKLVGFFTDVFWPWYKNEVLGEAVCPL
jgi:hypothetical protein